MHPVEQVTLRVSYLELSRSPAPIPPREGEETVSAEKINVDAYLDLYARIGRPLRWDQRLKMPRDELAELLHSDRSSIYPLRDQFKQAVGLCEFERDLPEIELKNFGLISSAQGRGLGSWLLLSALHQEWRLRPQRIWLHTDEWDHPAAINVYERAGFRIYRVRDEPAAPL